MLRPNDSPFRSVLRNRLGGDIPNPRLIASFVVRLCVAFHHWLLSQKSKKDGRAVVECSIFALLCSSVFYNSFRCCLVLLALSSDHRRRIAPRSAYLPPSFITSCFLPAMIVALPSPDCSALLQGARHPRLLEQ